MNLKKHIILCGFMASGKTTIGKLLAKELNTDFVDTDEYLINKYNMNIPEIFSKYGEAYFRNLEHEITVEISKLSPMVISTGGGLLTFDRNGEILKKNGCIILLERDFDTIYNKISNDKGRPLANGKSREELFDFYSKRIDKYNKYAHFTISNNKSPKECVYDILQVINMNM